MTLPPFEDHHLGDLLSALVDGELSTPEETAARRHLGACALCTAELADISLARRWVRGLPPVEPPFGFFEHLVLDARGQARGQRAPARRRVGVAALAVSAAAALALLGIAPPRDAPVSPSVARLVEAHATGASLDGDPLSRLAPLGVPVSLAR